MHKRKQLIRFVIVLISVLVLWVVYVSSKQIERSRRISEEVASLQTEADKIQRENETLSEKISYFSSSDFREREAKEKLGMQKTDENVVVIKSSPAISGNTDTEQRSASTEEKKVSVSNYMKWWQIFFNTQSSSL